MPIRMPKCTAILPGLVLAFACAASAGTIYNVNGTFVTGLSIGSRHKLCLIGCSGPLNGGSFSGTFSAALPLTNRPELITSFNIDLLNSSGVIVADLTQSDARGWVKSTPCLTGKCDVFSFTNSASQLLLITPPGFTGGQVLPTISVGWYGKNIRSDLSLVATGNIDPAGADPAAEPGTFLMLGLALLAGLWMARKRLLAKSLTG